MTVYPSNRTLEGKHRKIVGTLLRTTLLRLIFLFLLLTGFAHSQAAPFDLIGPKVDVHVERAGKTLPISAVPNLLPGDRVWIHPDMPDSQSAHYFLIVAFLRGATNPPPENWFTRAEVWNKKVHQEGIFVVVPQDAEQALIFLAPETGGGFATLRNAVRGRPGAFVRASQDLNVASLDRARLDKYLAGIQKTAESHPEQLEQASKILARSLAIKVDPNCFDKPVNEQAACLTAHTDQLVLNDGHSQSMVSSVTSGASADLISQLSSTSTLGAGGSFSPYVGAIVDIARILDNLHTAEYQYIPALAVPQKDTLNLRLNNPPSFHNPKSVIVIGLPPVEPPQFPPLRAIDPKQTYCLEKPNIILPVEGAPLVFATEYAHDVALHVPNKSGQDTVLPVTADPEQGGFVLNPKALDGNKLEGELTGNLRGSWGFHPFDGPSFHLASARAEQWNVAPTDESALIVGRRDALHLHAAYAACVADVTMKNAKGDKLAITWKVAGSSDLDIQVPLENTPPGAFTVAVKQFGLNDPDQVHLQAYAEAGHLASLTLYAGDQKAILRGTRLDEVATVDLGNVRFVPGNLERAAEQDELHMSSSSPDVARLFHPQEKLVAKVALKDGRTLPLAATISAPRPSVTIISKSVQLAQTQQLQQIHLSAPDELPQDARLAFSLKTNVPASFSRDETIEIANGDESLHTTLNVSNGSLTLADAKTVIAQFDPAKDLGPSAFGPLQFRPVDGNGVTGEWQPLADLVRLPTLTQLKCPKSPNKPCTLTGSSLFLIDSIASDAQFTNSISVPEGYADLTLSVPHPDATRTLYIKLRDDPAAVNTAQIPLPPESPQAAAAPGAPSPTPAANVPPATPAPAANIPNSPNK